MPLATEIFRAYDIRGIVDQTLTEQAVFDIGRALGTKALGTGERSIIVGRDGRISGPRLSERLTAGILSTGCNVIDIGLVPTPVVYFAVEHLNISAAVMITGSHNPIDYNGLKITLNKTAIYGTVIQEIYHLINSGKFTSGNGEYKQQQIIEDYINAVAVNLNIKRKLKIVIDCGNGAAGNTAPALFKQLGCDVIPLYCEIDGNFPHHHPDPSEPHNLVALQQTVLEQQADLGLAFDGDGDRVGIIDNCGKIIWPDRLLMLFAQELLTRKPGATIIYDVKCSRDVANVINQAGGVPLMFQTGHSLIKAKMRETGALLAAEMSGHIFFQDRWYGFDDALYTGARLIEFLSNTDQSCEQLFQQLPELISTPELSIQVSETSKFAIMQKIINAVQFAEPHQKLTIDGLRVEFADGWGLIRPSNTTPKLVARFEAVSQSALQSIQQQFKTALLQAVPELALPF